MKRLRIVMLWMLLTPAMTFAQGHCGAGGGDGFNAQFEFNVSQIKSWIGRNHLSQVDVTDLLPRTTAAELANSLLSVSSKILEHEISVTFQKEQIFFGIHERTCRNIPQLNKIECNINMWNLETAESRYTLVLHEMMGIAGLERNDGDESEYKFSSRILPFVTAANVYILADRPALKFNQIDQSKPIEGEKLMQALDQCSMNMFKKMIENNFGMVKRVTTSLLRSAKGDSQRSVIGKRLEFKLADHDVIVIKTNPYFTEGSLNIFRFSQKSSHLNAVLNTFAFPRVKIVSRMLHEVNSTTGISTGERSVISSVAEGWIGGQTPEDTSRIPVTNRDGSATHFEVDGSEYFQCLFQNLAVAKP